MSAPDCISDVGMETSIAAVVFVGVVDTAVSTAITTSGATESGDDVESDGGEGRVSIAVTVVDDSSASSCAIAAVATATVCGTDGISSKGDTETSVGAATARDSMSLERLSTEMGDDVRCC